jgi:hypothetical protein
MAAQPVADEEFARLHAVKDARQHEQQEIYAFITQPADIVYDYKVSIGDEEVRLRFKRFTYATASMPITLPFYGKLLRNEPLDEDEQRKLLAVQVEMCLDAIVDKGIWRVHLQNPVVARNVFDKIAGVSGMDATFTKKLEKFVTSDWFKGRAEFWLMRQGRTPSDIGSLPDLDVKVIEMWLSKRGSEP